MGKSLCNFSDVHLGAKRSGRRYKQLNRNTHTAGLKGEAIPCQSRLFTRADHTFRDLLSRDV